MDAMTPIASAESAATASSTTRSITGSIWPGVPRTSSAQAPSSLISAARSPSWVG